MKLRYSRETVGRPVPALTFCCLLVAGTVSLAQTAEQPAQEREPIVFNAPGEASADENAEIAANPETPDEEELELIVLEEQEILEESVYEDELGDISPRVADRPESYDEKVQRLFIAYREAVFAEMFGEADTLAKQIVELSIGVNGLDSRKTATALTNLAVAQHGMEQYESAILNYTAAINIIERIEDRLNDGLINPLRGLGAAQFALARPDLARKAFDRAIHISHVNDGPHNLDQIESLMSLSEIFLSVGETKKSVNIQKRIFYLQARNTEPESLDIIPALRTRAGWQRRMQFFEQERFTWRRILRIIENKEGKESLDLIGPLTELAGSYAAMASIVLPERLQPHVASGEPYLKRAVRIAERNPDATFRTLVDAKMKLADYYLLIDKALRAIKVYQDVWNILSEDESRLGLRASLLESGLVLRQIYPPTTTDNQPVATASSMPSEYHPGTVRFRYNVNTRGRATRVALLDADPEGLDSLYKKVGHELRYIVHRPRFVDGEPAESVDLTFSHQFYYRDEDLKNVDRDEDSAMMTDNAATR